MTAIKIMLEQIDTPALMVDAVRYEQNIKACFALFAGTRVTVRPHLQGSLPRDGGFDRDIGG